MESVEEYFFEDDGIFPNNSTLPVLVYRHAINLPILFPAAYVTHLFEKNNWKNSWKSGILTIHHYHSITHEVLGVYKGTATIKLGGEKGMGIKISKGDVLIIPAGVAHKNMGKEDDIQCVGAYPYGMDYDMNYGTSGERPKTDRNIKSVPIPKFDPVFGKKDGLFKIW